MWKSANVCVAGPWSQSVLISTNIIINILNAKAGNLFIYFLFNYCFTRKSLEIKSHFWRRHGKEAHWCTLHKQLLPTLHCKSIYTAACLFFNQPKKHTSTPLVIEFLRRLKPTRIKFKSLVLWRTLNCLVAETCDSNRLALPCWYSVKRLPSPWKFPQGLMSCLGHFGLLVSSDYTVIKSIQMLF